jgi:hypothetical protein
MLQAADASGLARAGEALDRAERLLGRSPSIAAQYDLAFARGLYFALAGDWDAARRQLKVARKLDPKSEEVHEAFEVLGN